MKNPFENIIPNDVIINKRGRLWKNMDIGYTKR